MKKNKNINMNRIVYFPILIVLSSLISISLLNMFLNYNYTKERTAKFVVELSQTLSKQVTSELEMKDRLEDAVTEKLLSTGKQILADKAKISNESLNQLAENFDIDRIYYYNPDGKVMNSSNSLYIGWTSKENDPIDNFRLSGKDIYMEEVRKSTESDQYFKFVYLRDSEGYFVQLGLTYENVVNLTNRFTIAPILDGIVAGSEKIVYALATNMELVAIYDTDAYDIGVDYGEDIYYNKSLNGEAQSFDCYYDRLKTTVLEASVPLYYKDEIIGIVGVGVNVDDVRALYLLFVFLILVNTVIILILFFTYQIKYVVSPLAKLGEDIEMIDINHIEKRLDAQSNTTFVGIYDVINKLLRRLSNEANKISALNEEVSELARIDYLTRLPNRFSFNNNFEQIKDKYEKIAILLLDLDNFKEYNDIKGHSFGDNILKKLAEKLSKLQNEDTFISRFGGDEFLISIVYDSSDSLKAIIDKILNVFDSPINIEDSAYFLEASMGVSLYPKNGVDLSDLSSKADMAMYTAKAINKTSMLFFSQDMEDQTTKKVKIQNKLKKALENDGFKLLYQPIININTNEVVAYEALIRIKDSTIYPDEFIPVAEDTGLIIEIGRYVLNEVINLLSNCKKQGISIMPISINYSSKQLDDEEFVSILEKLLYENNIDGSFLIVEITESFILEDEIEKVKEFINSLKKLGVKIAIDDFGSGYSSLFYVNNFGVDKVKLDKKFIENNLTKENLHIMLQWVSLSKLYGYELVAEGIETRDQMELMMQADISLAQGYYYSRPMEESVFLDYKVNINK